MKNKVLAGVLFINFLICATLAIIINNILIDKCGTLAAYWAGLVVSMLLWSFGYSFLSEKDSDTKTKQRNINF